MPGRIALLAFMVAILDFISSLTFPVSIYILAAILDFKLKWTTVYMPRNVRLYCISSSLGGHVGLYMLINIPSLDLYKFTSYALVWLKSLVMEIRVKNTSK